MNIENRAEEIRSNFERELQEASSTLDVENLKVRFLGKKGPIQSLLAGLRDVAPEDRRRVGGLINDLKRSVGSALENRSSALSASELTSRLEGERMDVTMPGRAKWHGHRHVILRMLDEAVEILERMGFVVQYGPDVEKEFYNFESLNFAPDHPARDMQDTFYITKDILLRTHTSNTQVRVMESHAPPIRVIAPGKCYRSEDISSRSHVVFHQVEGFYIDEGVTFADLFSTLEELFTALVGRKIEMRFRPSYFPFVEPGLEVDIGCVVCEGSGCSVCKKTGWLEVTGAGMIHPEVLKSAGIDSEKYSGFAWGFGIERLAMLRYGIGDIRLFMENDLRFLRQF